MERETSSDKENAPPLANRQGGGKPLGFARSDVLSDISSATLCASEVHSSTYQVQCGRHAQRALPMAEALHRDVVADPPGISSMESCSKSQYVDMYYGTYAVGHPLPVGVPVFDRALYPLMFNSMTTGGPQQVHRFPIHKHAVQHHHPPPAYAPPPRCYSSHPTPFWAFQNLPDKIHMTVRQDGEVITRRTLRQMTEIEIEHGEKHQYEILPFQTEDSDCRRERCRAIRWMSHRCTRWGLNRKTLFLAVAYLDKYIAATGIRYENIMREASACLRWACKFEEVVHPPAEEFCQGLGMECTVQDLKEWMDKVILKLDWRLMMPNIYECLKLFILHTNAADEVQAWAMYLAELCLMDASTLKFRPAVAAIACLAVALARCNAIDWRKALGILSGYLDEEVAAESEANVATFINTLIQLQHEAVTQARRDANHYLRPVVERFKSGRMHHVSQQEGFDWSLAMALSD
ncbi:hypothetical protein BSKO_06960 [Bryopsis sp. KO-2023]|nr:hypothetical protein BSKO_06960 [Bryopsis sp. KO-2023]